MDVQQFQHGRGPTTAVCGAGRHSNSAAAARQQQHRSSQHNSATATALGRDSTLGGQQSASRVLRPVQHAKQKEDEEARLKARREHAERAHSRSQQRVRVSASKATTSAAPESQQRLRTDYSRLRSGGTPAVNQQRGPRQEIRARGERLRPITHRLRSGGTPAGNPSTR